MPLRLFDVEDASAFCRTIVSPEIIEYLDSGKILLNAKGEKLMRVRPGPEVDYRDGED